MASSSAELQGYLSDAHSQPNAWCAFGATETSSDFVSFSGVHREVCSVHVSIPRESLKKGGPASSVKSLIFLWCCDLWAETNTPLLLRLQDRDRAHGYSWDGHHTRGMGFPLHHVFLIYYLSTPPLPSIPGSTPNQEGTVSESKAQDLEMRHNRGPCSGSLQLEDHHLHLCSGSLTPNPSFL